MQFKFRITQYNITSLNLLQPMLAYHNREVDFSKLSKGNVPTLFQMDEAEIVEYLLLLLNADETSHQYDVALKLLDTEPQPGKPGGKNRQTILRKLSELSLRTLLTAKNGPWLFDTLLKDTIIEDQALKDRLGQIYPLGIPRQHTPAPLAAAHERLESVASTPPAASTPPLAAAVAAQIGPSPSSAKASKKAQFFSAASPITGSASAQQSSAAVEEAAEVEAVKPTASPAASLFAYGAAPPIPAINNNLVEDIKNSWNDEEKAKYLHAFIMRFCAYQTFGFKIEMDQIVIGLPPYLKGLPAMTFYDNKRELRIVCSHKEQVFVSTSAACLLTDPRYVQPYLPIAWSKIPDVKFLEFYLKMQASHLSTQFSPEPGRGYKIFGAPHKKYRFGRNKAGIFCFDSDTRRIEVSSDYRYNISVLNKQELVACQYAKIEENNPEYFTLLEDLSAELKAAFSPGLNSQPAAAATMQPG